MRKYNTRRISYGFVTTAVTLLGLITGASCSGDPTCNTLIADWTSKVTAWQSDQDNPELGCPALEATLALMDSNCQTEEEWQQMTGMTYADYRQITLDAMETLGCEADTPDETPNN